MKKTVLSKLSVGLVFIIVLVVSNCISFAAKDDFIDLGSVEHTYDVKLFV